MQHIALKSSAVRSRFSEFMDTVVHDKPQVINRNRDHVLVVNMDHLGELVKDRHLTLDTEVEEDGSITASLQELPELIGNAETKEQAIEQLANLLAEYATDYLTDSFNLYFNAPNRRHHFPLVVRVAMQNDLEGIKRLIHE